MPKNPDATNNIARTTAVVVVVVIETDTVFLIFIILNCGVPIYYRLDNLVNSHYRQKRQEYQEIVNNIVLKI